MTADDPPGPDVAAVLAAIVPTQRQPLDEDCTCEGAGCPSSYEARHAAEERETWRDIWDARYTARQIRRTEQR